MKDANICRPITFYNTFTPISKNKYACQYCAFGTVDGIDVGENILSGDDKSITEKIWESQKKFCLELNGCYTAERIYAVVCDEIKEEEKFWKVEKYPFFFFCRMQCKDDKVKAWENRKKFEQFLQKNSNVYAKLYLTFDNSDFLLVLRTNDYETGAGLIDMMHSGNAEMNEFCVLKNSYTIFAVRYSWLNAITDEQRIKYNQKTIQSVNIRVIQEPSGAVWRLKSVLQEKLGNFSQNSDNFKCVPALGADDYVFILNNIGWGDFLFLYKATKTPLFQNVVFYDFAAGVTTQILQKADESGDGIEKKIDNNDCNPHGKVNQYKKKIDNLYKILSKITEKEAIKEVYIVLNALNKVDSELFNDYAVFPLLDALTTLFRLIQKQKVHERRLDKEELHVVLKQFSMYAQSAAISDKHARQMFNFDTKIYDIPIMLSAFYNAVLYNVKTILNTESDKSYSFYVMPGMNDYLNVKELYQRVSDTERLMSVEIPEYSAYEMRDMMTILTHEAAHYVGTEYRSREFRKEMFVKSYVHMCIQFFKCANEEKKIFKDELDFRIWDEIEVYAQDIVGRSFEHELEPEYIKQKQKYFRDDLVEKYTENIVKYKNHFYNLKWILRESMLEDVRTNLEAIFYPGLCKITDPKEYKRAISLLRQTYRIYINHKQGGTTVFNSDLVIKCLISLYEECFADLMAILILDMDARDYFNTFLKSSECQDIGVNEIIHSNAMLRLLAVQNTMLRGEDNFSKKWQNQIKTGAEADWGKLSDYVVRFWEKIYEKDIKETYKKDFSNVGRALQDRTIVNNLVKYLSICKEKFLNNVCLPGYSSADLIQEIRDCFNMPYSVEMQIIKMEKVISNYKEKVMQ